MRLSHMMISFEANILVHIHTIPLYKQTISDTDFGFLQQYGSGSIHHTLPQKVCVFLGG